MKQKEKIVTVCYNNMDTWTSRERAMAFFRDCINHSEGSERDRYTTIFFKLMDGMDYCTDEQEW